MSKEEYENCTVLNINFSEYDPEVYKICQKYTSKFCRTHMYRTEIYNEGFEKGYKEAFEKSYKEAFEKSYNESYQNTYKKVYENSLKIDYKKGTEIIFNIMLESDLDNEFISSVTKMPVEEIAKLREGKVS